MNESEHSILIIVNDIPPYKNEIVNVLAKPNGGKQRFRYRTKYVPTIDDIESLEGHGGSIILRNRNNARFLPIRTFTVHRSRLIGDVAHIQVSLSSIACLDSNIEKRNKQVESIDEMVVSEIGQYENPQNGDLLNLVLYESGDIKRRLSTWCKSSHDDDIVYWGNCIETINVMCGAEGIDFYRIVGLCDSNGNLCGYRGDDSTGYELSPGESYTLEVLQRTYTEKEGDSSLPDRRSLKLSSNSSLLDIKYSSKPLMGKYDLFEYDISIPDDASDGNAKAVLNVVSDDSDDITPPTDINVEVRRSTKSYIIKYLSGLSFCVFLIAFLFSGTVEGAVDNEMVDKSQVEKISIIFMLITSNSVGSIAKDIVNKTRF
jgi:hypothetical protein